MRKAILSSLFVLLALPLLGQEPTPDPARTSKEPRSVAAEFVSANSEQKTVTVKVDATGAVAGQSKTLTAKVEESVVASLRTFKAGEKVTLTCYADGKGDCETVTAIVKTRTS